MLEYQYLLNTWHTNGIYSTECQSIHRYRGFSCNYSCWRIPIESKKIFEIQWFRGNHVKMLCSINNTICIPYLSTISIFITSNSSNKTFNKPHKHFVVYSISCGLRWAIHITLLLHSHTLQWGRLLFAPNFPFLFLRRLVISLFL